MRIRFRVDDYLKTQLDSFDLPVAECVRCVVKKIKAGKLSVADVEMGKLSHVITVDLDDDCDIPANIIRDALYQVFQKINNPKPKIDPSDLKYKPLIKCSDCE